MLFWFIFKNFKTVLENFRLPYITVTPTFSVCPKHGYLNGEHEYCPCCQEEQSQQRCEVYTRVMGYHSPVSEFNLGKQSEHKERMHFQEPWDEVEYNGCCGSGGSCHDIAEDDYKSSCDTGCGCDAGGCC